MKATLKHWNYGGVIAKIYVVTDEGETVGEFTKREVGSYRRYGAKWVADEEHIYADGYPGVIEAVLAAAGLAQIDWLALEKLCPNKKWAFPASRKAEAKALLEQAKAFSVEL